jgi:GMP synthase (glutamine-hydrolysing)
MRRMSFKGPHLLILRAGHTAPEVMQDHGDYDRWFTDRMAALGCRFAVRHVPDSGLPDTTGYDGILVSGTAASVLDRADWMRPLAAYLARSDEPGPPVLAVCFGAQIAADALGGRIEENPLGWEIGTVLVDLSEAGRADPLFDRLPGRIEVQATHRDNITRLPRSAALLAGNRMAGAQAFGVGRRLRALQFHPEANGAIIRRLIRLRRKVLEEEARRLHALDTEGAREAVSGIEAGVRETDDGKRILENWVRHFVLESHQLQKR